MVYSILCYCSLNSPYPLIAWPGLCNWTTQAAFRTGCPPGADGNGRTKHRRRREDFGQLQFGLITLGGESMPLTHRLLNALQGVACWVYGEVPAGIETADRDRHAVHVDDEGHPTDAMARTIMVTLLTPDGSQPDDFAVCPAQGTMTPVTLTEPLLLLTATRPVGWPL